MQFKIILKRVSKSGFIPFSYQYELSAAIYSILETADPAYSYFLHSEGYGKGNKRFKPFTFSMLQFDAFKTHAEHKRLEHTGSVVTLEVRFIVDKAVEEFIKGLFLQQEIGIGDKISRVDYIVSRIESLEAPVFEYKMKYRALSPIFISVARESGHAEYLSPEDYRYENLLKENLLNKLSAYHAVLSTDETVGMEDDFQFTLVSKPRSKMITFKSFTANPIKLKAFMYDFELLAPPVMQEVGYYGGFGGKNAQGLGCVRIC